MKKKPSVLPRGYRTCTASLAVSDVPAALAFYEQAFGAKIQASDKDSEPNFATIKIGNSMLFVTAGWGATGHLPASDAHAPIAHHMYVENVDATYDAALAAGARPLAFAADAYWGERCATIADPFGHIWTLATRCEALTPDEIEERRNALLDAPTTALDEDESKKEPEAKAQSESQETPLAEPAMA